jgi:DNA-binding transcriptional MerR regulator
VDVADSIRRYEKIGVLPMALRSPSGYRIYPQSAIERVTVVHHSASYMNQGFAGAQAIRFLGETFSWVYGRRV